ncbi:GtrA family protein [Streptomyces sp. NPDC054835]|uniref:GtrA family protein n=1 Tax=Streptomyces sp. NBC_01268 TaxID=2903806 RepID=UPI002E30BA58|nr:GtrA family protein [Streptomyces sp. NBC_01268]
MRAGGGRGRHELLGFAVSGAAAYAADLAVFLALHGPLGPVAAKSSSFLAGCTVAYLGNAFGTYRRRSVGAREYAAFFGVNLAGAGVQLLCLAVSHYGLGLTSAWADTVSGLGVGMALATCLRFWGNRTLVFRVSTTPTTPSVPYTPSTEGGSRTTWTG